jgi:hypothetical protein
MTSYINDDTLFLALQNYIDEIYVNDGFCIKSLAVEVLTESEDIDFATICESPKLLSCEASISYPQASRSLEDLVHELDETFSEHLIRLIDQKGLDDPYVYKKANVDRKLFSKIKNNIDYKPKKSTALSFAFALELSLDETLDLIGRAGFTLSHSSKFDVIIEFFLQEGIYDMFTINNALFAFGEPTLTD